MHPVQENLVVLTSGTIPLNPSEVLGSAGMSKLVEIFSKSYDYVILDTSPISVVTDASVLSQYTDGVIFVVRQNMTTFEQAKLAKSRLEAVNANILGVVMNDFDIKYADNYSGNHYYYYNYAYGAKKNG